MTSGNHLNQGGTRDHSFSRSHVPFKEALHGMRGGNVSADGADGTALRGRQSKGKPIKESLKFRRVFWAALRTQSIISQSAFCQESLQDESFSPAHAAFRACDVLIRTALVKKP